MSDTIPNRDPVDAYCDKVVNYNTAQPEPKHSPYIGEKFQNRMSDPLFGMVQVEQRFKAFKTGVRRLLMYTQDFKGAVKDVLRSDSFTHVADQVGLINRALDSVEGTCLLKDEETQTIQDRRNARFAKNDQKEILSATEYRSYLDACIENPLILLTPALYFRALQKVLETLSIDISIRSEGDANTDLLLRHVESDKWSMQPTIILFIAPAFYLCAKQTDDEIFGKKSSRAVGEFLRDTKAFTAMRQFDGQWTEITCPNQPYTLHLIGSGEMHTAHEILKQDKSEEANMGKNTVEKIVRVKRLQAQTY